MSLATKMSASKLIHYFSSHPAAFGFGASTPPDNISLNSANRKVDQSLSLIFRLVLGAAAHATLDTGGTYFSSPGCLVDTLSTLPEAEGDVIPVSEVVNYFSGFMHFGQGLFPSELEIIRDLCQGLC